MYFALLELKLSVKARLSGPKDMLGTETSVSNGRTTVETKNKVTALEVERTRHLVTSVQNVVIKPLHGMSVLARVKGCVPDGDYTLESTKQTIAFRYNYVPLRITLSMYFSPILRVLRV
jgi:hypothetical protein